MIRRMYESGHAAGAVKPSPESLVVDGANVAVEIDLIASGSAATLGDFFTLRPGLPLRETSDTSATLGAWIGVDEWLDNLGISSDETGEEM